MLEMVHENGKRSAPQRPSFADSTADDFYPSFSPDGQILYFGSRRKPPQGYPQGPDMRILRVAREGESGAFPSLSTIPFRSDKNSHTPLLPTVPSPSLLRQAGEWLQYLYGEEMGTGICQAGQAAFQY